MSKPKSSKRKTTPSSAAPSSPAPSSPPAAEPMLYQCEHQEPSAKRCTRCHGG